MPAVQVFSFLRESERKNMNDTVVFYNGEQVSVPKEVAEFLRRTESVCSPVF